MLISGHCVVRRSILGPGGLTWTSQEKLIFCSSAASSSRKASRVQSRLEVLAARARVKSGSTVVAAVETRPSRRIRRLVLVLLVCDRILHRRHMAVPALVISSKRHADRPSRQRQRLALLSRRVIGKRPAHCLFFHVKYRREATNCAALINGADGEYDKDRLLQRLYSPTSPSAPHSVDDGEEYAPESVLTRGFSFGSRSSVCRSLVR